MTTGGGVESMQMDLRERRSSVPAPAGRPRRSLRARRALGLLARALLVVVVLVAVLGAGGYVYLRQSLPQYQGSEQVAGISAPIRIIRDADRVPHIYAATEQDALFGLGFVHAQDRLWEMEVWRRITDGTLAEIFGPAVVGNDRFFRVLGLDRAGRTAWDALPMDGKAKIQAYVDGVNSFVASHKGAQLPPEFHLLQVTPRPWTGADALAWAKIFQFDLASDMWTELLRDSLLSSVGPQRTAELLPTYPADGPVIGQSEASAGTLAQAALPLLQVRALIQDLTGVGGPFGGAKGSNAWVVDGTKSTTGKPILANDPHLTMTLPGWYQAHLSAGDFDVMGATIPGLPGVVLGHNRYLAWGFTGLNPDVEDLYRERLDATGRLAEFQGRQEPLQLIPETIKVRLASDVHLTVRISRHGPLISDAINGNDLDSSPPYDIHRKQPLEPMALRWPALDREDPTVLAFLGIDEARSWDDCVISLRQLVAPGLNFVYADTAGHIGYYASAGRVPIRPHGDSGVPLPGWTGEEEWTGWVPFEALPHVLDPAQHFIVTANNRPVPDGYPYHLGNEWYPPYRAERITQLLEAKPKLSPADMGAIQNDTVSLQARELLPRLLPLVSPHSEIESRALDALRSWNYDTGKDSVAASIYEVWLYRLPQALVADKLKNDELVYRYQTEFTFTSQFLAQTFAVGSSSWCAPAGQPAQGCAGVAERTFQHAVSELEQMLGDDVSSWHWGRIHHAHFWHVPFYRVPPLKPLFDREAPNGGDWSTIDMGAFFRTPPTHKHDYDLHILNEFGPSYRQIIDLGDLDQSRFIESVGQSGHFLSPYYDEYLPDWLAGRYRTMRFDPGSIKAGGSNPVFELRPKEASR